MAYMSQENKKVKAIELRKVFKKYNVKASVAVRHHSTLVVNVKSSAIDFIADFEATAKPSYLREYIDVNPYHYEKNHSGQALAFITDVLDIMNQDNFNKSDIQSDYHHVGWYTDINIGSFGKPYTVSA